MIREGVFTSSIGGCSQAATGFSKEVQAVGELSRFSIAPAFLAALIIQHYIKHLTS